ncbi:MAG: DUF2167 domain-containing protein [Bernardetiaceae bacterium]|nr:DUF2167 domain-containing protein [Bernardetiaceae bacterium]
MKRMLLSGLLCLALLSAKAQQADSAALVNAFVDSIEATLNFQTGTVTLKDGLATIKIPAGFKFLDAKQAQFVLSDLWNNPPDDTSLGLLVPGTTKIMGPGVWAFDIVFDEMGYVEDDDADDIDYDELLTEMKADALAANEEREKQGYTTIELVGWAAKPYYDANRNILHWAKELKFGESPTNILNYNVRMLGRKGVLVLNAIADIDKLPLVQQNVPQVLSAVNFNEGNRYADFDPDVDEVAAWTIGGLVAGKILSKAGFFAVIAKFAKPLIIGLLALLGGVWKWLRGRASA